MGITLKDVFAEAASLEILNHFTPRDAGDAARIRSCALRLAEMAEVHYGAPEQLVCLQGEVKKIAWSTDPAKPIISLGVAVIRTDAAGAALARIHPVVTIRGMLADENQDTQLDLPGVVVGEGPTDPFEDDGAAAVEVDDDEAEPPPAKRGKRRTSP